MTLKGQIYHFQVCTPMYVLPTGLWDLYSTFVQTDQCKCHDTTTWKLLALGYGLLLLTNVTSVLAWNQTCSQAKLVFIAFSLGLNSDLSFL